MFPLPPSQHATPGLLAQAAGVTRGFEHTGSSGMGAPSRSGQTSRTAVCAQLPQQLTTGRSARTARAVATPGLGARLTLTPPHSTRNFTPAQSPGSFKRPLRWAWILQSARLLTCPSTLFSCLNKLRTLPGRANVREIDHTYFLSRTRTSSSTPLGFKRAFFQKKKASQT